MIIETRKEAVERWVNTFDCVDLELLKEWNEKARDGLGLELLTSSCTEGYYPMWGYMWSFKDRWLDDWVRENADVMDEIGFTVFDSDFGCFIGIDGAGYNFYDAHWEKFYLATGMKWSEEDV